MTVGKKGIPAAPLGDGSYSRRVVLAGLLGLPVSACATLQDARPERIGLADITVRRELQADYAGTLRQASALGFRSFGFRLFGYGPSDPPEPAPQEKARLVREAGLAVGVVRLSPRNADYDRELSAARDVGASIVAMTVAPPFISGPLMYQTTCAQFDAWLPQLVQVAEKARERGLTLAYHNHWFDLTPLGAESPLETILRQIDPSLISFEVDLGWCWYAGVRPVDLLTRLRGRVVSMHWKDIDRRRGTMITDHAVPLGSGEMDYRSLLPAIRRLTSAPAYIEVDRPDDGLEAARQGIALALQALS